MKKRMIALFICILMVIALVPGVANAQGNTTDDVCRITYMRRMTKEQRMLERMVGQANKRIEQLVWKAQKTPWNDVAQLQWQVNVIVAGVFAYADCIGAELECEYVAYYVDGQRVLIDPIRIIRL